ncbi:MAG: KH domain-containing protein [Calditrichia bacterium]
MFPINAKKPETVRDLLSGAKGRPVLLALNKIDLLDDPKKVLPMIEAYQAVFPFTGILPISAERDISLDKLVVEMVKSLPIQSAVLPDRFHHRSAGTLFCRRNYPGENFFTLFSKEIPYATHVEVEEFRESNGAKDYIRAVIYAERQTQKQIIIGKKGEALKRVGASARKDIEQFLDRPVFLELFVKVSPDWRKRQFTAPARV